MTSKGLMVKVYVGFRLFPARVRRQSFVHLFVLALHFRSTLNEIIEGPRGGVYLQGADILLKCVATESNYGIIWEDIKENTKIFIGKHKNTDKQKYENFQISSIERDYSLRISNAAVSDEGQYTCQEGDVHINATIIIEAKPKLILSINGTSTDQYTVAVGDTIVVSCKAHAAKPNVSLELKFGTHTWIEPALSKQAPNGQFFDTFITYTHHAVARTDNPLVCRAVGQSRIQIVNIINMSYKPHCTVNLSDGIVACECDANPPIIDYKMYVNGKMESANKSVLLAKYSPANFSCSGENDIGTGHSSTRYFTEEQANAILGLILGIAVCCLLVVGLISVNIYIVRKRRRTMTSLNLPSHPDTIRPTSGQPYIMECPQRRVPPRESSTVIEDSIDIYAEVYANAPKDKFVTLTDIRFGRKLKTSRDLDRWRGKLRSIGEVVVSSPPENASPITQLHWAAFVKSLLDLPKVSHIVHVRGICIEKGNFYLLQEYVRTGTLRQYLASIQYTKIKRDAEVKPTSNVLLELASSLVHGIDFILRQKFYHPGLSSDKVLIANENVCKLYNFCTADNVKDSIDYIANKMKEGNGAQTLPPEAVFTRVYDEASEMWSLAATIWEIFTHGQKAKFNYLKELSLQDPLQGECKLKKPQNLSNDIYELMTKCWSKQPSSRPKIFQLKNKIDEKFVASDGKAKIADIALSQDYEPMTGRAKSS